MIPALITPICEPIATPSQEVITQRPAMWKASENLCMLSAHSSITAQHSDSYKLDTWIKGKQILNDHAIGVDVDDNMNGTIYDNGCTAGEKFFQYKI